MVYDRSAYTGKEKKVDCQITADLMATVFNPVKPCSVIMLMSGDADMTPGIHHVLSGSTVNIEIFGWKDSLSSDYTTPIKNNHYPT